MLSNFTSIPFRALRRFLDPFFILLLTVAGFAVMGYHPGFEDDGIYLSAVKSNLNPALYPHDADFVRLQVQATVFDEFIAGFVRLTRIPVAWAELLWQFLSLYSSLWAAWRIAQRLFAERRAQWAGVASLSAMFTLPVAGTALNLADQHLHPRTMATALVLIAIDRLLARRLSHAALLLLAAMLFHPIMGVFGISFCVFLGLVLTESIYLRLTTRARTRVIASAFPLAWVFDPPTPAWRRALDTRTYYFLAEWKWYEWLGAIGPLVIFWMVWRCASRQEIRTSGAEQAGEKIRSNSPCNQGLISVGPQLLPNESGLQPLLCARSRQYPSHFSAASKAHVNAAASAARLKSFPEPKLLARICFALLLYGIFQQALAAIVLASPALVRLTPLQPMRYLHLVYVFLVLIGGGLLGRHVLRGSAWRWAVILVAAYGGMFLSQRRLLPDSDHLELPGRAVSNPWLQAFAWIRQNTPSDAYFALDPHYLAAPGEDYHSFRALAERSQLADAMKDPAVVTQVPELASRWVEQVDAQAGWAGFQTADFERLKVRFGVGWVLIPYPAPARLICQWHNHRLSVCRVPGPAPTFVP